MKIIGCPSKNEVYFFLTDPEIERIEAEHNSAVAKLKAIKERTEQQESDLNFVIKTLKLKKDFSSAGVLTLVDYIFTDPIKLKKAWDTPGFPFIGLNGLWKDLTGKNHPVFLELFGQSFIAGTYLDSLAEKNESKGNRFSLSSIKYLEIRESLPVKPPLVAQA